MISFLKVKTANNFCFEHEVQIYGKLLAEASYLQTFILTKD